MPFGDELSMPAVRDADGPECFLLVSARFVLATLMRVAQKMRRVAISWTGKDRDPASS